MKDFSPKEATHKNHTPRAQDPGMGSLTNRYTMESERKIHQQAIFGEGKEDQAIELFEEKKPEQEDALGDNVELF